MAFAYPNQRNIGRRPAGAKVDTSGGQHMRARDIGRSLEKLAAAGEVRMKEDGSGWLVARRAPIDPEAPEVRPPWVVARVEQDGRWQVQGGARMGIGVVGLCRFLGVPDAVAYAAI